MTKVLVSQPLDGLEKEREKVETTETHHAPMTAASQRHRMEMDATRMILNLMGIPTNDTDATSQVAETSDKPKGKKRLISSAGSEPTPGHSTKKQKTVHSSSTSSESSTNVGFPPSYPQFGISIDHMKQFYDALEELFDKLPVNQGAHLAMDDLFSYVDELCVTLSKNECKLQLLQKVIEYLKCPPFTSSLGAFGKLPNHPYIFGFNPDIDESVLDSIVTQSELNSIQFKDEHLKELLDVDNEMTAIFNEPHPDTGIRCGSCGESRFLHLGNRQKRRADEGSAVTYHCLMCRITNTS